LQATVFFRVARDGRVEQLHLVQASGNPLFDASLIRAIKRASPLPVLPTDYPGEMLEVEMRFRARES
jgi:TonB family protein